VLGLSPKEVHASLDLVTKLTPLPKLTRAWRRADVNARVLRLMAKVTMPRTQDAWLRLADRAALSRIELEVAYQEALLACASRDEYLTRTGGGMPQFGAPRSRLLMRVELMLGSRDELGKRGKPVAAVPTSEPDDALLVMLRREDPLGLLRTRAFGFDAPPAVAAMIETMMEVSPEAGRGGLGGCMRRAGAAGAHQGHGAAEEAAEAPARAQPEGPRAGWLALREPDVPSEIAVARAPHRLPLAWG